MRPCQYGCRETLGERSFYLNCTGLTRSGVQYSHCIRYLPLLEYPGRAAVVLHSHRGLRNGQSSRLGDVANFYRARNSNICNLIRDRKSPYARQSDNGSGTS
jgi:hypothetical protein